MSPSPPDASAPRRVVITGAAGLIGRAVTEQLSSRWDLVATDIRSGDGLVPLDVMDETQCGHAFAGADAVVHLAANPDEKASWDELHPLNTVGVHAVASATMAAAVPRLVLASSLQAVLGYPPHRQVRSSDAARPANVYGATKAWAEAVGSWVASSSDTTVVALRIGYFSPEPPWESDARDVAAWLSPTDGAELVRAAVEGPVDDFVVINGVSANRYRHATYGAAEKAIGYRPMSDAWASLED